MVSVVHYQDRHQASFKELNKEWLDRYSLTEPRDLEVLDHPERILDAGGVIFIAESDTKEVVGSAALIYEGHGIFELAKMGVAQHFRQRGVGQALLHACVAHARMTGTKKIILFSNHKLEAALRLYEKSGFRYVAVTDSPFQTADIKMEMEF